MNKTITIKEIFKNNYKSKEGYYYTIIDTEETYYNSFNYNINTNINMGHIKVGKTYELEYSSIERNGKIFNTIANFGMEVIDVEEEFETDTTAPTEPQSDTGTAAEKPKPISGSVTLSDTAKRSLLPKKRTLTREEKWDMKESEKNEYIVKESALKSAVEAIPTLNPEASVEDIIATAIRFVKFIKEGA